jgi:hypothetical protein
MIALAKIFTLPLSLIVCPRFLRMQYHELTIRNDLRHTIRNIEDSRNGMHSIWFSPKWE